MVKRLVKSIPADVVPVTVKVSDQRITDVANTRAVVASHVYWTVLLQYRADARLLVVECDICANFQQEVDFVFVACGPDNLEPSEFGQLDNDRTHSAGGRRHVDSLSLQRKTR